MSKKAKKEYLAEIINPALQQQNQDR